MTSFIRSSIRLFARVAAQRGTVFFRKTSEKLVLGAVRVRSVFRRGHYDTIEETVFLFDRNLDCWSDGRYMFIANVVNFERMFRYFEQLQARAQQTVDAVLLRSAHIECGRVPSSLHDADSFHDQACSYCEQALFSTNRHGRYTSRDW